MEKSKVINNLRIAIETLLDLNEKQLAEEVFNAVMKHIEMSEEDRILNKAILDINMNEKKKAASYIFANIHKVNDLDRAADLLHKADSSFYCPVSRRLIQKFEPMPNEYKSNFEKYGFPYSFDDFETLNYRQYTTSNFDISDRERLYALYIAEQIAETPIGTKIKIMDFAPSQGFMSFMKWHKSIEYTTADIMPGFDMQIDIQAMNSIEKNTFDAVICSHVLEHVESDTKAISEIRRILKPNGWAILMSPMCTAIEKTDEDPWLEDIAERWKRFGQDDHVRLYSKNDFITRIKNSGFGLKMLDFNHFGIEKFGRCGIAPDSVLYVAQKV